MDDALWRPCRAANLDQLPTPSLILDLDVLDANIRRMAEGAQKLGVKLRPHFKTSRSLEVARLQEEAGCFGFTVSNLRELRVLAESGRRDITWAYPIIPSRVPEIAELCLEFPETRIGLVVDSDFALDALLEGLVPKVDGKLAHRLPLWLKVDCGYHRVGVDPEAESSYELAARLGSADGMELRGILSHSGHSYNRPGHDHALAVAYEERDVMAVFAARLRARGIDVPEVSIGSTPAMSALIRESGAHLEGVTEMRPGNYVFYDRSQVAIGSCDVTDCAVTVWSSVVSCSPGTGIGAGAGARGHSVIDAGALSLSKDAGPSWLDPPTYGDILRSDGTLDPNLRVVSLSQEHGILSGPLPVGERVRIVANHSCLTVPRFREYVAVRGDRIVGTGDVRPLP